MANGGDPVNILLSNHQLLVVLFVAVAWVLKKIGLTGKEPAANPAPGTGISQSARTGTDDEVAERTRRVQGGRPAQNRRAPGGGNAPAGSAADPGCDRRREGA